MAYLDLLVGESAHHVVHRDGSPGASSPYHRWDGYPGAEAEYVSDGKHGVAYRPTDGAFKARSHYESVLASDSYCGHFQCRLLSHNTFAASHFTLFLAPWLNRKLFCFAI